ncbi:MAG: hypothetical protein M3329_07555, partial [Pseudomonadota bacterium]|nr:hypothetical protein [Pseudomonadota bacterium]
TRFAFREFCLTKCLCNKAPQQYNLLTTFGGGDITNVEINCRPARSMTVARNLERCCFPLPSAVFIPLALH